jgi:hypothetical protein
MIGWIMALQVRRLPAADSTQRQRRQHDWHAVTLIGSGMP